MRDGTIEDYIGSIVKEPVFVQPVEGDDVVQFIFVV